MENSFIIENLLEQQVGDRLEFQGTVNKQAIAKTIAAFINAEGGDLLIGVHGNKRIVGVENAEKVRVTIQEMLVEYIQPIAPIFTQVVNYKRKDLIHISVWEGAKKPYQFKGNIFIRENDSTKLSSISNLTSLIKDRKEADFHWERRAVLGATLLDLDTEEINQTIALYKEYKPNNVIQDVEDFLIQMGLIQNGNLTNACIVLFGNNPSQFISQSKIRITVYPSSISGDNFLNDKIFDGSLFQNITAILNFIEISFGKNIVVDGILRKEQYNYPLLAVREGLLNAMVHRDYNSVNGFLQISIFSDRTEISNYGGLPHGITIKDLKKEHNSILRNPDIAQICFIRKYIEMLGSGTLRMVSDCKKNGFRMPFWTDKNNITTVTFPGLSIKTKVAKGVNEGVNEGVKKVYFKAESEGVNEELNLIYSVIEKTPGLKAPAIAKALGVSLSTAERYIRKLKDAQYIKFVGIPKTGGYFTN
ncbi:MAG: putative DNA binding domain-containing protein [Bacteroidia bacterium]|nr:putative DNA binding domain-containing protein [Bacteroidia bacterium]